MTDSEVLEEKAVYVSGSLDYSVKLAFSFRVVLVNI